MTWNRHLEIWHESEGRPAVSTYRMKKEILAISTYHMKKEILAILTYYMKKEIGWKQSCFHPSLFLRLKLRLNKIEIDSSKTLYHYILRKCVIT